MSGRSNKDDKIQEEILETLKAILKSKEEKNKPSEEETRERNKRKKERKKLEEERELLNKYGYKKSNELLKGLKRGSNIAYAKFKKEAVTDISKFTKMSAAKANVYVMAVEEGLKAMNKLNKASLNVARKASEKTINIASHYITKTMDTAMSSMKDPINGLNDGLNEYSSTIQNIGNSFGMIGKAIGGTFGNIINGFSKFESETLKEFSKLDHESRKFQKAFGLNTEQIFDFRKTSIDAAKMVAEKWGKTYEDMFKAQKGFIDATGKNIVLGESDYNEYFGLSQLAGDENAMGITAGLQEFNHDISSASDMYFDMYKNAQKVGVSIEKSTKDVLNNLKLANKYNFKEGSKSIMDMAVWANKTKFNLSSISGIIDKISGGGVESSITSAAQLQVLGGEFAIQSNPLGMLYEALEDPEALAKRVQKMAASMGRFDVSTGETKLNANEIRMLQNAGKAIGMSPEEMNVMAKEATRRTQVEKQLMQGSGLTEEQKDLISSKAQWDKEAKQFYLTDIKGNRTYANEINTSNIGNFDFSPDLSNEEKLVDYAEKTFSQVDEIAKVVAGKSIKDAELGERQQGLMYKIIDTANRASDMIYETFGNFINEISYELIGITETFLPILQETLNAIVPIIPELLSFIKPITEVITNSLLPTINKVMEPMLNMSENVIPLLGDIAISTAPIVETFINLLAPIVESVSKVIAPLLKAVMPLIDTVLKTILPIITTLVETFAPSLLRLTEIISEVLNGFYEDTAPAFSKISESLATIQSSIIDIIGPTLGAILDILSPIITVVLDVIAPVLQFISTLIKSQADTLSPIIRGIYNIVSGFMNIQMKIWSALREFVDKGIEFIKEKIFDGIKPIVSISNFFENITSKFKEWTKSFKINDGIVTSNGIIKTNSQDEIIAAKEGVPFDMLFNDMYDKISDVYAETNKRNNLNNTIVDDNIGGVITPKIVNVEPIGNNSNEVNISNKNVDIRNNSRSNSSNMMNISPINININGKLDLVSNGVSINIIDMLKENPLLMRKITEMVIEQIGSNINGGKTTMFRDRYTI